MKIVFILLILSMSSVHAFELIDSKKFQSLSREQQVRYLTEVQKIVVGITKKSSYSAEAEQDTNRNPANSRPNLNSDDWSSPGTSFGPPSTNIAPQLKPVAEPPVATTPKPEPVATTPAAATEQKPVPAAQVVAEQKPRAEPKPTSQRVAISSKVKPTTQPQKSVATSPKKHDPTHFRCMHTGFVVKKDPCTGFQKVPDWMGIDGLVEKNKSCASGYSVCNPIIFGLKFDNPDKCKSLFDGECSKTAKPFCARRGMWPTEECHKMATANGNMGTWIAAEISSQIKPSLYEEFKKDMETLCNPEKIKTNPFAEFRNGVKRSDKTAQAVRDDLTQTCGWATKQLNVLNETIVDNVQLKNTNSLKPAEEGANQK